MEFRVEDISNDNLHIQKAESNPTATSNRIRFGEIGSPYLKAIAGIVREEERRELQFPRCLKTYDEMRQNATVAAALAVNEVFLTKALMNMKVKAGDENSEKSVAFAKAVKWNLNNLKGQTWYDVVTAIITYQQYGFSWLEKVYERNDSDSFPYSYKIKKLAPRSPKSVKGWLFSDHARDIIGLEQWPQVMLEQPYENMIRTTSYGTSPITIPRNKILLFSWNNKNHNPQGISDLNGCYRAYKELSLIASYEVTGVSKDLAGVLVLRVPTDIINRAAEDPNSDEAKSLAVLQKNAASVHAGDQTYMLLGSDTIDGSGSGKYAYDVTLQGVEGGSKSYKTTELIQERKKQILDSLGCGFLNLGNDGVGSYALATGKQSLHAFYMERHLLFIKSVLENDLFKQLAEINGIRLTEDEMPRIEFGDLDQPDLETYSKMIQRLAATGVLPKQKAFLIQLYQDMGLDTTPLEGLTDEEFVALLGENTSRSGDGMAQGMPSGTGNALGNNSDTNSENAA